MCIVQWWLGWVGLDVSTHNPNDPYSFLSLNLRLIAATTEHFSDVQFCSVR